MSKTLTLENIDKRLDLYIEYMSYFIDEKVRHRDLFAIFKRTGNLYYSNCVSLNFEQWLALYGKYDLIVSTWTGFDI